MDDEASVEYVPREVIERAILAPLSEERVVAILAEVDDLDLLISALDFAGGPRAKEFQADLQRLRTEAFGEHGVDDD